MALTGADTTTATQTSTATSVLMALLASAALLAACAPGGNEYAGSADAHAIVAGFWRGLWHGIIAPITFVVSLFKNSVGVYEVHNNGGWYDFGFLCGMLCFHGGHAARGVAKRRRAKRARIEVTVTELPPS